MAHSERGRNCNAWYHHPIYAPYWEHYKKMQKWMSQREYLEKKERAVVDQLIESRLLGCNKCQGDSPMLCSSAPRNLTSRRGRGGGPRGMIRSNSSSNSDFSVDNDKRPKRGSRGLVRSQSSDIDCLIVDEVPPSEENDTEVSFEYEITDEYLEYARQTKIHKIQREAQKKREKLTEVEYVDLASVPVDGLWYSGGFNMTESIQKKQQLAKKWFGGAVAEVTSKESAIEVSFNWIHSRLNPPMWPNIPLRIKFD